MKLRTEEGFDLTMNAMKLKYLKIEKTDTEFIATLVDKSGYEILKGYGANIIDAIDDLHYNLF